MPKSMIHKISFQNFIKFAGFIFCLVINIPYVSASFKEDEKVIISHAGGGMDGLKYINSLEVVLQSIQKGFQYIELDLLETTDGDFVAAHDWITFHRLTGHPHQKNPLSLEEVNERKILKNQNVLTSEQINTIFTSNKELYLVTDKTENINLIKEKFSAFLDRIVVEFRSFEQCEQAQKYGIKYCAFWFNKKYTPNVNIPLLVTMPFQDIEKNKEWLLQHQNIKVLTYTINDSNNAKKILRYPFIKGIYTDFLAPNIK